MRAATPRVQAKRAVALLKQYSRTQPAVIERLALRCVPGGVGNGRQEEYGRMKRAAGTRAGLDGRIARIDGLAALL